MFFVVVATEEFQNGILMFLLPRMNLIYDNECAFCTGANGGSSLSIAGFCIHVSAVRVLTLLNISNSFNNRHTAEK